ncbi:type VI secretion system baseplate subunit TssG [Fibrella forsythiae]|uniref:Type VI secretion system baseplate subunit TssG n=1 Tax=Fibrella forsythiae TaxID=2817061 RepID=A0ABS3JGK2_9BACT|nr:type VI secretion system baseplate subunit TssG [Fibrella forsythiae]MBO0949134.1 type VI secretion system baseplate subunit TssG [Fibrella forsythiae]
MTLQQYADQLDRLTSDVRLEVILAELTHDGLDPRRELMVHPAGLFSRSYRHDVGRALVGNTDAFGDDAASIDPARRQYLNVEVHRDGLYDYLPEGLFHQPTNLGRDRAEVFEDIDEQARRQRGIRQFFQPLEQEFYLQGLAMELEERKYFVTEENLRQNSQGDVLRQFWGLPPDLLDIRQLTNLLHLLPIAHRLVHNTPLVMQVFELMLGVPVQIRTIPPLVHQIELALGDAPAPNDLSKAELGNFSLGGAYQDTMPAYEIRIGPLNGDQLIDYLANGRCRAIMNLLIGYFMPSEADVIDHLLVNTDERYLTLNEDELAPASVLGVASYI